MPKLQVYLPDGTQAVHDLTDEKITIGRLPENDLQIEEGSVSSRHAELVLEHDRYHLHDLGSTNGTFVNEEPVTDVILSPGDQMRFGSVEAVFSGDEPQGEAQPMPEASALEVKTSAASARPESFHSASPVPKPKEKRSPIGLLSILLAILALLGMGAVAAMVMTMEAPI